MIDEDELVSQALDLPEAERIAYVDARCGSDFELKSRVVGLLQVASLICDKESYKQATISREVRDFLHSDLLGRKKGLGELHPQTISSQYQLALYYLGSGDETEGLSRLIELERILKKSDFQSTRVL